MFPICGLKHRNGTFVSIAITGTYLLLKASRNEDTNGTCLCSLLPRMSPPILPVHIARAWQRRVPIVSWTANDTLSLL